MSNSNIELSWNVDVVVDVGIFVVDVVVFKLFELAVVETVVMFLVIPAQFGLSLLLLFRSICSGLQYSASVMEVTDDGVLCCSPCVIGFSFFHFHCRRRRS